MDYKFFLVKNRAIIKSFDTNDFETIKKAFKDLCDESDELDVIEVFKVPFDVSTFNGYRDLKMYGTSVTLDYLDEDANGFCIM